MRNLSDDFKAIPVKTWIATFAFLLGYYVLLYKAAFLISEILISALVALVLLGLLPLVIFGYSTDPKIRLKEKSIALNQNKGLISIIFFSFTASPYVFYWEKMAHKDHQSAALTFVVLNGIFFKKIVDAYIDIESTLVILEEENQRTPKLY